MSKYIPFTMSYDDVPIDLSFIYASEKPAGKHGFLQIKDEKFVFEDGTQGRFWGTNFNSGLNFPDFDFSKKIAVRLAKIGINMVRFHQLDAEWATPNIFAFTKGPRLSSTRKLDTESMKRLDYLIYCLKNEGIYCYLDMMTYRKFKTEDGVENAISLVDSAKPYSVYSRKLIELQKQFAHQIWSHVNEFTGLAYKDDPVFVMTEITNECDLFFERVNVNVEPYLSEYRKMFKEWAQKNEVQYDTSNADIMARDQITIDFKVALQEAYYREMIEFMRSEGVKIPIAGTNWPINAANTRTQLVTDFCDSHAYWYSWQWGEGPAEKRFENRPMSAMPDSCFSMLAFCRMMDRPFFVSEWDVPWPGDYRAEGPLLFAAVSALQGWGGCAVHTYAYDYRTHNAPVGKEMSSASIGGIPYREGVFTTWNDPAKFGLFYHSALIVRRGDVRTAKRSISVLLNSDGDTLKEVPALQSICEMHKAGVIFEDQRNTSDITCSSKDKIISEAAGEVTSDTGELYRSWDRKYGRIDTAMTKCAYGCLKDNGSIKMDGLTIKCDSDFAVIAISSISDKKIEESDNILLTAVGRSENTGMEFNEDHTKLLDFGKLPVNIEVIEAEISIKSNRQDLKVWAVSAEGFFIGALQTQYKDGALNFRLGEKYPSMYYLIQTD